jgi:glycolate oxidase iron-sulfur subunit
VKENLPSVDMTSHFYEHIPLPDYEQLVNCIHCGMCLPVCPTYALTGLEKNSPRGRIRMIRAVADGELDLTDNFKESLSFCLNCQACVTACPAGVEYGQLVEAAQLHVEADNLAKRKYSRLKRFSLDWLFGDLRRLRILGKLMRLYQWLGIASLIQRTGALKIISGRLHEMSFMAPKVPPSEPYSVKTAGVKKDSGNIRVGILPGCIQDVFFRDVNQDTIDVLSRNGYDVFIPDKDYCCGSVHGHNGNIEMARQLARNLIDIYEAGKVDCVVMNSAGCGAFMKEYGHLLAGDPEYAVRAERFAAGIKDISEILTEHGWQIPPNVIRGKVTYHEPCHLVHTQKISRQPRELIASIPGITFVELPEATWCCGSAGIYNITRYEDSMRVLERKMNNIKNCGADYVVTGNPGCMIQLIYGAKKFQVPVRILHPVSLLNQAYNGKELKV